MAQKVAEIIYTYESDSDNSNSTLASPVTPHENTNDAVKDTRSNILQRIMERYRRAERYSDLKKLLELLEKRGFFNPEIKYDKQRYNPSPEKAGLIAGLSSSFDLRENSK